MSQKTSAALALDEKASPKRSVEFDRLQPTQQVRRDHRLVVRDKQQLEDFLAGDRETLKIAGAKIQSGDILEIVDDGSSVFVLAFTRLAIPASGHFEFVELLRKDLGDAASDATPTGEWNVMYRGPYAKWCVIRPNGTIHREGFMTRELARQSANNMSSQKRHGVDITY